MAMLSYQSDFAERRWSRLAIWTFVLGILSAAGMYGSYWLSSVGMYGSYWLNYFGIMRGGWTLTVLFLVSWVSGIAVGIMSLIAFVRLLGSGGTLRGIPLVIVGGVVAMGTAVWEGLRFIGDVFACC